MIRVANTYWVDERIKAQRVAHRAASLASVRDVSVDIIGSRADVRRRGGVSPSGVVFGMVLLATLAVCITVNMRTRAKMLSSTEQYAIIQTDVDALRSANRALRDEINQLTNNPRAEYGSQQ